MKDAPITEGERLLLQWVTDSGTTGPHSEFLAELRAYRNTSYQGFLDDMGKLLQVAMPRTDRERDELFAAEAEVQRLRSQLAIAEERQTLARQRYDRERALLMEMFETWKAEVMALPVVADGG